MRNGVIIGMAIGAILGAVLVEGNPPAAELVQKGKQAVKQKVNKCMKNSAAQDQPNQ